MTATFVSATPTLDDLPLDEAQLCVEAVQRGAQWLDEVRPGWADLIDLDRFDFTSCSRCVAGQLFGWTAAIDFLAERFPTLVDPLGTFGFDVPQAVWALRDQRDAAPFVRRRLAMGEAWRVQIALRRRL